MKQRFIQLAVAVSLVSIVALGSTPSWAQAVPGRTLRVNGIDMFYEVRGAGEPLVLLHGFGRCGQDWGLFVDSLAKHYQLVIVDLPGHGGSTGHSGVFTHRQAANDVFALLDQIGVTRFRAMGISSGGMTLLHMATQQPERVVAMVLIGATSYFPEQARAIMAQPRDRIPLAVREAQQRCARRGDAQVRELATQFTAFKDSYDDMNFTAPYLSTIKARTFIVHGDRDVLFPVSIPVDMYRAIPGAALWIVPQGGHVPIFGPRAREFEDLALEFLQAKGQR